jgi:rhodanese-related sulfurtransferase
MTVRQLTVGVLGALVLAGCGSVPGTLPTHEAATLRAREVVPPNVSVQQVATMLAQEPGLVILDVRSAEQFATGHILGSRLAPMNQVFQWSKTLDPKAHYVCVGQTDGHSGMTAWWLLNSAKTPFTHVENMTGGLNAWTAAGLPLVTGSLR